MEKSICLPDEMIEEILLKLPAKSLVRFSSLSPAWNSRIHSPAFVKKHKELNKDSKKVMMYTNGLEPKTYSFSVQGGAAVEHVPHDIKVSSEKCFSIVGSCNGLMLVAVKKPYGLFIWNPSTRERKQLPLSEDISCDVCVHGFGCANSSDEENCYDDFKVIIRNHTENCFFEVPQFMLYTTRTNSWRRMADMEYFAPHYFSLVTVNGKLHFLGMEFNRVDVILAFDFKDEKFRKVPEPIFGLCNTLPNDLVELNGNLCVISSKKETPGHMYVWMMKEYGVKESWTNIFCINTNNISYPEGRHNHLVPLHLLKNGQILLHASLRGAKSSHLLTSLTFFYDFENHNTSTVKLDNTSIVKLDDAQNLYFPATYVETLISPNAL